MFCCDCHNFSLKIMYFTGNNFPVLANLTGLSITFFVTNDRSFPLSLIPRILVCELIREIVERQSSNLVPNVSPLYVPWKSISSAE